MPPKHPDKERAAQLQQLCDELDAIHREARALREALAQELNGATRSGYVDDTVRKRSKKSAQK